MNPWRARRARWARHVWWGGTLAAIALCLCPEPALSSEERCPPPKNPAGLTVPLDRIDDAIRCQVAGTVDSYTTLGAVGPVQAPVTREIYEYLLDHPWLLAEMARQLNLGNYEALSKGQDRFWASDGDGTEGLVQLAYRNEAIRLYYIDGSHHGRIFPVVRAKAVVLMRVASTGPAAATPAVETALQAYTRLDDPVLDALVRLLRPLLAGAVTRKLTRSFEVLNQICNRLAQDPVRTLEATAPSSSYGRDLNQLKALLNTLAPSPAPPPSASPAP